MKNRDLELNNQESGGFSCANLDGADMKLSKLNNKILNKEKELKELQEIVSKSTRLEDQKLQVVRDKAALLSSLINNEDLDENAA